MVGDSAPQNLPSEPIIDNHIALINFTLWYIVVFYFPSQNREADYLINGMYLWSYATGNPHDPGSPHDLMSSGCQIFVRETTKFPAIIISLASISRLLFWFLPLSFIFAGDFYHSKLSEWFPLYLACLFVICVNFSYIYCVTFYIYI